MDYTLLCGRMVLQKLGGFWVPALPSMSLDYILEQEQLRINLVNNLGVRVADSTKVLATYRLDV